MIPPGPTAVYRRPSPRFLVPLLMMAAASALLWHFDADRHRIEPQNHTVAEPSKPRPKMRLSGVSEVRSQSPFVQPPFILQRSRLINSARLEEPENDRGELADADQPDEAIKWRLLQLVNENGIIPDNALLNAWEQRQQIPMDPSAWPIDMSRQRDGKNKLTADVAGIQPNAWTWLGPGNVGGRIRSIVVHPTDPQTMWIGSVGGGIWKTTNGGTSWAPLDDFMANLAVSTIAIDPTNPNVLYAGTGEGFFNGDALRGAGIFKTTDGGTTWSQLSSTANSSWYFVNRIAISPSNSQIILAATETGIWRTTDGGASWTNRTVNRALDINFNPTDGSKCVAGGKTGSPGSTDSGFALYSTDGGLTWNTAIGLGTVGRVEVAYSKSNPSIVYASANASSGQVYRSTDGGQTYSLVNTGTNYLGSQGWYDNIIWVDPTNSNVLVVGGIDLWRSSNGGTNFTKISDWQFAPPYGGSIHSDHHIIVESSQFGTGQPVNRTVLFGNDGGIYRASDVYNVSQTSGWTELNNNLGITQFYGGAGNPTSGRILGGAQDNGTLRYTGATETWNAPFGGDGGWCASDPTDQNYFYGEYVYLQIHRSTNGGSSSSSIYSGLTDAEQKRANFIAPFILDPNNPNTLLGGADQLWRSTNVKALTPSWSSIKASIGSNVSAVAVAKGNSNIIWVGHNNGNVYFTTNGTAVSPTWTRADLGSPALPDRYCTRITIDPANSSRVYVTFGGFSSGNVWRTDNSGTNWTNITGNLPNAPVYSLAVWQQNLNNLYVGTEVGIFASANGGQSWSPSNDGPTNCSVDELFWMNDTLVAVTHGRGMFSINITGACAYNINPASQNFGAAGGNGSFNMTTTANCPWSAVSDSNWITTSSSGSGNGTVNFSVAANSGSARNGTITVGGQVFAVSQSTGGGCPSTTINFGQMINGTLTTADCFFTGTTRYVDVYNFSGVAGQQIAVSMNSQVIDTYLYLLDSGNQLLAEDDDGGGGTNSRIPTGSGFFVLPGTGTYTIYATSYFQGETGSYSISLSTGTNCSYSLNPTSQIFISSASAGSFSVLTDPGCSWSAVSNIPWLTTTSSGTGNGTVNYSVAVNSGNARNGTITVADQTFSVFQSAGNGNGCPVTNISIGQTINTTLTTGCVFTGTSRYVDPYDFSGTAGQQIAIAMSSSAFDTYLFLNDPNNQTIAQDDDGGGNTDSRIPAFAGFYTLPLTGTYRIFATSYSADGTTGSTGAYTISVFNAASCSYPIAPISQSAPAGISSNQFTISAQPGCPWTASSNANWINTSSTGSGGGTINYSVSANTGGARSGTITVGGQTFTVNQSAASTQVVQLSSSSYSVGEGAGVINITVNRAGDTAGTTAVNFGTTNGSYQPCGIVNGVAAQNCDFIVGSGTLSFSAGETSKTFSVIVLQDLYVEGNETLQVTLSSPLGAVLGAITSATITIIDDDTSPPSTNPLDNVDQRFFVTEHYYDFLNRLPDQPGLDYWAGQITQCGANQACVRNKRVDVSNAFFFEQEYQQTAAYVFRMFRAAFGNNQPFPNPDTSNLTEAKKIPSYVVFAQDRARLVGSTNLAQDQLALANAFVQRAEFLNKYPANLTSTQLVDALIANIRNDSGADLGSQRDALVTQYNQGGAGMVMYRICDDNLQINPINNRAFIDSEYNRSFVFGEYGGYLRRDSDMGGFLFWLGQINRFAIRDGNAQHAMVCSFTTSSEYQQRFSPIVSHNNSECPQ